MKSLVVFIALSGLTAQGGDPQHVENDDSVVICGVGDEDTVEFRRALYDFNVKLYKKLAVHTQGHFIISAPPIWQSLAAIAEGAGGDVRRELFRILGVPEDECARQSLYQLVNNLEQPGFDVTIKRTRILFVDESLNVNADWQNLALNQFNLITAPLPIKRAPQDAAFSIRQTISSQLTTLNLEGNSVLTDTLDYHGLWSEAFSEAGITRAPFYDHDGKQIGSVDLMRIKKRVRMVFLDQLNANVVEIPVGHNSRYRMLFGIPTEGHDLNKSVENLTVSVLFEMVDGLKETHEPINVAIPRFLTSTECDVRALLEEVGVDHLWTDATGNISYPAAVTSSFIQRAQITLDSRGVGAYITDFIDFSDFFSTSLDFKLGTDVIVNRPFMYGLFDVKTYTCLFSAAFALPTYGINE